jgi:hypothetical protein
MRRVGVFITTMVGLTSMMGACLGEQGAAIPPPTDAGRSDVVNGVTTVDPTTPPPGRTTSPGPGRADAGASEGSCAAKDTPCLGPSGCRTGLVVCADRGSSWTCVESGNAPGGQPCQGDKVCDKTGACVACAAGEACTPTEPCKIGSLVCATGSPVCTPTTNAADGSPCGASLICQAGACVACAPGGACTPADPCHKGTLTSCVGDAPVCVDIGLLADNGTTCGMNQVCASGACVACVANVACTPANECHFGAASCTTGTSVCVDQTTNRADGTPCGGPTSGKTCAGGTCGCPAGTHECSGACVSNTSVATCGTSCTPCAAPPGAFATCDGVACGISCARKGEPCVGVSGCRSGTIACTTDGGVVCVESANAPPGQACGAGGVCNGSGACVSCAAGAACTPSSPCKVGSTTCTSGAPVCTDSGNVADGTACGTNMICSSGACVPCAAGGACTPTNPCHQGKLEGCSGQTCVDTGAAAVDGTTCGPAGSGMTCTAGNCTCAAGWHDCAGTCMQNTSVAACGASCTACQPPAGATATCNGTTCGFACDGTECDPTLSDRCEPGAGCSCGPFVPDRTPQYCTAGTCVAGICQ